jgi:hypothetical protein
VCCSACVGCLRWIPTQKDAKTQFLVPWHPTAAATNNLMADLYSANEMRNVRSVAWSRVPKSPLKTGRRTWRPATASRQQLRGHTGTGHRPTAAHIAYRPGLKEAIRATQGIQAQEAGQKRRISHIGPRPGLKEANKQYAIRATRSKTFSHPVHGLETVQPLSLFSPFSRTLALSPGLALAPPRAKKHGMAIGISCSIGGLQWQGVYYVAGPPSAPLLELAPLALLSFLVPSRHTRRSALPPGYRVGELVSVCEIAINLQRVS